MIKYNLNCHNNHNLKVGFDLKNRKFEKKKMLECIYYNQKFQIIMAPMISVIDKKDTKVKNISQTLKIKR